MPEPKSQPRQWAILVGVNYYFPGDVRKDPETSVTTRYGDLSGCVRDIKEIQQALLDTQRIAANDIKTLTSTKRKDEPGTGSPIEGRAQWPTYENIKKALEDVTADATPGDFVYFHYCGHGSRSRTLYQDLKTNRLDEGIAPLDINCGGRYLRDVELAFLLGKMVQKALVLTVVLDSCHSGGATRSPEGPEARGIPDPDLSMLPSDGADTPVEELRAAWNAEKARDGQSWLLQPSGYVLLAGCLPHEQSYEGWFSDASGAILKNGRLSYWLVEALREGAAAPVSYRMLHRRIHESMLVDRSRLEPDQIQTPVLVGDGERVFFARGSIVQGACVAVRRVNRTDFHSLELAAGEAHGVSVGSEYAVYEWNTRDISADTPAFKNIIVTDVFELTSKATILSGPVSKWPVGCQAVLLRRSVTAQTNIRLPDIRNPGAVADDMLTHIRTMPEWRGRFSNGIVPLSLLPADDKTSKAYSIIVNRDHQYQLCDVDGTPFPNLPATTDRDAILNSAVHLTQFQRIQRLNNDSKGDFMRCRCKFEVFKGKLLDGEEEEVKVRFTNLSDEPLNLTVFHLTSSWGIVQIYPVKSDFETVDKRDSRTRDITLKRTKQATSGVDVMKAFVTIEPTSFRILEMPEIDINTIGKASGIWVSNGTLPARIAHGHRTPEPRSPNQWRTGDIQSATMALLTSE